MLKKTKSILDELDTMYLEKDRGHVIESRASNVIASAIRLLEQIETVYSAEDAELLTKRLLSAIKTKDAGKFARTLKRKCQ